MPTTTQPKTFHIQIISDTVCLWCYIGLRRLQKAIQLYQKTYPGGSKDIFQIEWRPYILRPEDPLHGVSVRERMREKMGEEQSERVRKHMSALAAAEGIRVGFDARTGNTMLSHRFLRFAKDKGFDLQTKVAEEIFRLHFGKTERDITALDTMLEVAGNCGMDVEEVRAYLESDAGREEVLAEAKEIRDSGVKGVPRFVFQGGEHTVDSAGDAMDFFELLIKIKEGSVSS